MSFAGTTRPGLTAGGLDGVGFDHEHDGAFRRAWAMHDAFGNDDSLSRREGDGARVVLCRRWVGGVDEVDVELAFDNVKELVLLLVLVPVVVAFDDAEADDGVV